MPLFNDWHDYVRVVVFLINVYSIYRLAFEFWFVRLGWNQKTFDLWYAMTAWSVTGSVLSAQAVILDRPFTPGFICLVVATLVCGRAVHSKDYWGNRAS